MTIKPAAAKPDAAKPDAAKNAVAKNAVAKTAAGKIATSKNLSAGQRAYEEKRAAKAGMSLDKWLTSKQRAQEAEQRSKQKLAEAAKPAKKPGLFARLIERAHRPLGGGAKAR